MPAEIQNDELYHDRTVQDWHRETFPKTDTRNRATGEIERKWTAIDLDLLGACSVCFRTLYLIEATTRREKGLSILFNLAEAADVAAVVIRHTPTTDKVKGHVINGRVIYPTLTDLDSEAAISAYLANVRAAHVCAPRATKKMGEAA